jgi:hypothetical protein
VYNGEVEYLYDLDALRTQVYLQLGTVSHQKALMSLSGEKPQF